MSTPGFKSTGRSIEEGGKVMDHHSRDEIARVAYELYVKGGWVQGRDLEYWFEAERIVAGGHAAALFAVEPREKGDGKKRKGKRSVQRPATGSRKSARAPA
jgi:hypothetical protein